MKAFTLIETLLTIALVSLVTAMGIGLVSGASQSSTLSGDIAAIINLDRRARQLGQRHGPVELLVVDGVIVIRTVGTDEALARMVPHFDVELLTPEGVSIERVLYGNDARTEDFRVVIGHADRRHAFLVTGATGLMRKARP